VTDVGKTSAGDEPHVARTDDRNIHLRLRPGLVAFAAGIKVEIEAELWKSFQCEGQ
jgi:hypothetical protein